MSDRSIQQVIAFNQELAALAAAGLPLELGCATNGAQGSLGTVRHSDRSAGSISSMLDQANTALAMRIGQGQSLEQAVLDEPSLTPNYRQTLLTYLRCDDPRVALEAVSTPATARWRFARGIGRAAVYPMIVLTIAYLGFIYLSRVTGPAIEAMYLQVEETPPAAVSFLSNCRDWFPIWGILIPLAMILLIAWWRSSGSKLAWNWLPGSNHYYQSVNNAHVARQLSRMLESGCSLEESLQTMFPPNPPSASDQHRATGSIKSRRDQAESTSSYNTRAVDNLAPLLRWAIEGDAGDEPRPKILKFVAMTYQQTAERQERLWRFVTPTICGLLVGGLFVLGYGLSLFLPVVQMLKDVAAPGSGFGGV